MKPLPLDCMPTYKQEMPPLDPLYSVSRMVEILVKDHMNKLLMFRRPDCISSYEDARRIHSTLSTRTNHRHICHEHSNLVSKHHQHGLNPNVQQRTLKPSIEPSPSWMNPNAQQRLPKPSLQPASTWLAPQLATWNPKIHLQMNPLRAAS